MDKDKMDRAFRRYQAVIVPALEKLEAARREADRLYQASMEQAYRKYENIFHPAARELTQGMKEAKEEE